MAAERKPHGLVVVYTGSGKGKTTAALGALLRAWGHDMKVVMLQFIKSATTTGEHKAARKMNFEMITMGKGFTWLSKNIQDDKSMAQACWKVCQEKIRSGEYDIVIMDEATYPMNFGWVPVQEVIETLRNRPGGLHVIITGREAPQELIEFADLVTEMREIKHPYKRGIKAQRGLDF